MHDRRGWYSTPRAIPSPSRTPVTDFLDQLRQAHAGQTRRPAASPYASPFKSAAPVPAYKPPPTAPVPPTPVFKIRDRYTLPMVIELRTSDEDGYALGDLSESDVAKIKHDLINQLMALSAAELIELLEFDENEETEFVNEDEVSDYDDRYPERSWNIPEAAATEPTLTSVELS